MQAVTRCETCEENDMVSAATRKRRLASYIGAGIVPPDQGGGGGSPVWRGVSSRATLPERFSNTTNLAWGGRSNFYSPIPVRYIQVGIPTFITVSAADSVNGVAEDVDLTHTIHFQVGIDTAYTRSMIVPPRTVAEFGGNDVGTFDPAVGPYGVLETDVIDLGAELQYFSIFVVMQWDEQPVSARRFPRNIKLTNGAAGTRFEKNQTGSTTDLIAQGWATTRSDMGSETVGGSDGFAPYVKALLPGGTKSILVTGSSSAYGVAENAGATTAYSDAYGDEFGTRGYPGKYLNRRLGIPYANIAKPSDSLAYLAGNPARSDRRRRLAAWLNPTHIWYDQPGKNDVGDEDLAQMVADTETVKALFRDYLPGIPIIPSTHTPVSNSPVGRWTAADGSDQLNGTSTDRPGFGPGLTADLYNTNHIRALAGAWSDAPTFIDSYPYVSLEGVGNTYKFLPDPIPETNTGDGGHLTGAGAELVVQGLPASSPFD